MMNHYLNVIRVLLSNIKTWDSVSVLIYAGMIISSTGICFCYDFGRKRGNDCWWLLLLSFIPLWGVLGSVAHSGDYENYKRIFLLSINYPDPRIEYLYIWFNKICRYFISSFEVFNYLRVFLFLVIVSIPLIYFRKNISTCLFMFTFAGVYSLQSMNFNRVFFAAAITSLGLCFLLERKFIVYTGIVCIAFFVHRASIVMFIPLLYHVVLLTIKRRTLWHYLVISILTFSGLCLIIYNRSFFFDATWFPSTYYKIRLDAHLGTATFVYHSSLLVIFVLSFREGFIEAKWKDLFFVLMLTSFCVDIVAYYIDGIGRMWPFFYMLFALIPNYYLRRGMKLSQWKALYRIAFCGYWVFIVFRIFVQTEYFYLDEIMPYVSIFSLK